MTSHAELPDGESPGPITPFTIREITIWRASIACIVLPLLGELTPALAYLQFLVVPFVALALGITVLLRAWRTPRLLGALPMVALGVHLWLRLTGGVPLYVHRAAEPIVTAIRHYRDMHGMYPPGGLYADDDTPPELREVLGNSDSTQCIYSSRDDGFRVTCRGVMFNHCTYDSAENRWFVWD